MPCSCWYTPTNSDHKHFKNLCEQLVNHIKKMQEDGDPTNCTLKEAHELIDHLYDPSKCKDAQNAQHINN